MSGNINRTMVDVVEAARQAILVQHSPFNHDYVRDERSCDDCRLVRELDKAMGHWYEAHGLKRNP